MSEKLESGIVGGLVGAAAFSALMKIPKITSGKLVLAPTEVLSTPTLIHQSFYKLAIILFHGNGDPTLSLKIYTGDGEHDLLGDEQAIELVSNKEVKILAHSGSGKTPTIEILYLRW